MKRDDNIGDKVYRRLKAALVDGLIDPHCRLDIAQLADNFDVSATPLREAAMRLLGEGLLEAHPHGGTRPLRISEFNLRSLLELHNHLAEMSLRMISDALPGPIVPYAADNPEQSYRHLFAAIATAAENADLDRLFDHYADRLAPFRSAEPEVFDRLADEYDTLRRAVIAGEAAALRKAVKVYHRRRLAVVPQLVWRVSRRQAAL